MPKKKTSDDHFDEAIEQTLRQTFAALERRRGLLYDGIMGSLYASWPPPHHTQFENAREWILKRVSHADALRFLHDYGKMFEPGYNGLATIPVGYNGAIGTLYSYFTAMKLGEIEGLRMVADDNAVIGLRARRGHTKRKAAGHKPEIQRIGKRYWDEHPKAIVKDILICEEFTSYMKNNKPEKPYADRTIANWLREVDPRPLSAKRGPRSRKR